jgi:hypothetical protein
MRKHVQVLGILNLVWGCLGLLGALVVMLIFGGVVGLIGIVAGHAPEAGIAIPIVSLVGGIIFLLIFLTSLPAVAVGYGLLKLLPWGRILGIILSAIHLLAFPFGTALGIYGLWVLFSDETVALFGNWRGPVRI